MPFAALLACAAQRRHVLALKHTLHTLAQETQKAQGELQAATSQLQEAEQRATQLQSQLQVGSSALLTRLQRPSAAAGMLNSANSFGCRQMPHGTEVGVCACRGCEAHIMMHWW